MSCATTLIAISPGWFVPRSDRSGNGMHGALFGNAGCCEFFHDHRPLRFAADNAQWESPVLTKDLLQDGSVGCMSHRHANDERIAGEFSRRLAAPRTLVAELPSDAFVVCMTMGHATDRPILEEIFRQNRRFPFLGVIGSKAKRAVIVKELTAAGIAKETRRVPLPDRSRPWYEPARRDRDQRRGTAHSRARSLEDTK